MEKLIFNSEEELYNRVLPALKSKRKMISRIGFKNVSEKDIWDYLRIKVWNNKTDILLCELVDDILKVKEELVVQYCHEKYVPVSVEEDFDLPKLK